MPELLPRRTWLQLLAGLAGAAPAQQPPQRVTKEMLEQALKLIGLEFTEAQQAMMLPGVNRSLAQYESLRKIPIPLDTEPAFHFTPRLPGKKTRNGPPRFHPTRVTAPKKPSWTSLEELAFLPVTELAPLVRARLVSSGDLTRMYLWRLKQYGPKLNCVITLTEDLALARAERADREIRSGHYLGPLHGIPWRSEEHTSELQSLAYLVCRLLLEKKKKT